MFSRIPLAPRPKLATLAGILFILVYVVAVTELPQRVGRLHWALEAVYWCVAGIVWVFPIRWLMLWSVGKRQAPPVVR